MSNVAMRQHNVWCKCVTHVHQKLCCRITTFDLLHF